jgi:hypothetical protein
VGVLEWLPNPVFQNSTLAMLPKAFALVSTVLLLMSMTFFLLGTIPLLILKHKDPMDSRVVRQVFHYCYRLVTTFAVAACIGQGLMNQPLLATFAGGVAVIALLLHHQLLGRMDALRTTMHTGDGLALRLFRRTHVAGIVMNAALLAAIGWALTHSKL